MTHDFDESYWKQHWQDNPAGTARRDPNPYLVHEINDLTPGTALDAGCGEGNEAMWLAYRGWQVTAVDIASDSFAAARERDAAVRWVEADLTLWAPDDRLDLVMTHYAHPAMPQLDFYDRVSDWVAPGGTLLIVGHLHAHGVTGHDGEPPAEASATAANITARLDAEVWDVVTAEEHVRTMMAPGGEPHALHDVVVRATRRVLP